MNETLLVMFNCDLLSVDSPTLSYLKSSKVGIIRRSIEKLLTKQIFHYIWK